MRKIIVLLILVLLLIFPLIAGDADRDDQLRINAYYKGRNDFSIMVKDYTGRRLLYETNAVVGMSHLNNTGRIFEWGCSIYQDQTISVSFKFSRIQAYLSGRYYSPAYTLSMDVQNSSLVLSPNSVTVSSESDDHRYNNEYAFSYSGGLSYSSAIEGEYVTYGACYLNINTNDATYISWSPGDYEYGCQVSVEVTWE